MRKHIAEVTRARTLPSRPKTSRWDAVSVLTAGLIITCAIPSYVTVPALGPAGKPGTAWFLGALIWWGWSQLQRPVPIKLGRQPVRFFLLIFIGIVLCSYGVANFVGLPSREAGLADSGLLRVFSWAGILLIANDGIADSAKLVRLLRRVAWVGGVMALLGLVQFWSGESLIPISMFPGTGVDPGYDNIQTRAGFTRAAGTAAHPLEYATVLCMSLPIALTLAMHDLHQRWFSRWFPVLSISAAAILSVSRSALVGVVIGAAILAVSWPKRVRVGAFIVALGALAGTYFLVPGMIGTIRGLFVGLGEDSSVASRTNSAAVVAEFFERNTILGRGLGTFLPDYRILDNQYLGLLIEVGPIGLLAFFALITAGVLCCFSASRTFLNPLYRNLSYGILASLVAGTVTFAFFDALSFPMAALFMFLLLGLSGAIWRIASGEKRNAG